MMQTLENTFKILIVFFMRHYLLDQVVIVWKCY